jgi:hypothetical protein
MQSASRMAQTYTARPKRALLSCWLGTSLDGPWDAAGLQVYACRCHGRHGLCRKMVKHAALRHSSRRHQQPLVTSTVQSSRYCCGSCTVEPAWLSSS